MASIRPRRRASSNRLADARKHLPAHQRTLSARSQHECTARLGDVNATVAQLLLAPILVDTVNLDPVHKRTTPKDLAAVHTLERLAWPEIDSGDTDAYQKVCILTHSAPGRLLQDSLTTIRLYERS